MPIIDQATFDELKDISGEDFINELIDTFLEEAPCILQNMQMALENQDVEVFRRNAHSLKSNANTFGAVELAALARDLEMLGREGNLNIGNRLECLNQSYALVASALKDKRL